MKYIKPVALFVALLYLTIYLPLAFVVYTPLWYRLTCQWNPRCDVIGPERAERGITELTAFFRHQGELKTFWSDKEKRHLAEVRGIYDALLIGALVALALLVWAAERRASARFALANMAIILSLLAVLPFFVLFWRDVFHPLLFDNELWKTNRSDLTYYLTPRTFFKHTMALLIGLSSLINLAIWYLLRANKP